MNRKEVSSTYGVALEELAAMEQAGIFDDVGCRNGERDFQNGDIQKLSHVLSLRKIGLDLRGITGYLKLEESGEASICERKRILKAQRALLLSEIHIREKSVSCIDYLLFEMCGCDAKAET